MRQFQKKTHGPCPPKRPASPHLREKDVRDSHRRSSVLPRSTVKVPFRPRAKELDCLRQTVKATTKQLQVQKKRIPERTGTAHCTQIRPFPGKIPLKTITPAAVRTVSGPLFYLDWLVKGSVSPYFCQLREDVEANLHAKATLIQKMFRGYVVRKLLEETMKCGFCRRFNPKIFRPSRADIPAACLVGDKIEQSRQTADLMHKLRQMEIHPPSEESNPTEVFQELKSEARLRKMLRLRDLVGAEIWATVEESVGVGGTRATTGTPFKNAKTLPGQSKGEIVSQREIQFRFVGEEIPESLIAEGEGGVEGEGSDSGRGIEEELLQESRVLDRIENSIAESLWHSKGAPSQHREISSFKKPPPGRLDQPKAQKKVEIVSQRPKITMEKGIVMPQAAPTEVLPPPVVTQPPEKRVAKCIEESCQADLEPLIGLGPTGGLSTADRIWVSEAIREGLEMQKIQTEAILTRKFGLLERTMGQMIPKKVPPIPREVHTTTYSLHMTSPPTVPAFTQFHPFIPIEKRKKQKKESLSAEIDQLKARVACIREGKGGRTVGQESLVAALEEQVWQWLLEDGLSVARKAFKALSCA